jgi:hypothetical protein
MLRVTYALPKESHLEEAEEKAPYHVQDHAHGVKLLQIVIG